MNVLGEAMPVSKPLCGTRLDNAISIHHLLPSYHLPTSCFNDVVLVPLASWLFYAALAASVLALGFRRQLFQKSSRAMRRYSHRGQKVAGLKMAGEIIYTLLIIAAVLMNILEQVRLGIFKPDTRGLGLLPFIFPSIIIVVVLSHWSRANHVLFRASILLFWTLLLIFTAVKLRVLALLGSIEPRNGTEYLSSDQQLDVGVMVGLYGIFVIVESAALVKVILHPSRDAGDEAHKV